MQSHAARLYSECQSERDIDSRDNLQNLDEKWCANVVCSLGTWQTQYLTMTMAAAQIEIAHFDGRVSTSVFTGLFAHSMCRVFRR